ncbi:unnamed protein product [Symbiodinium microadriaticum]|nr:unnamed protein product [Symbiodinium microadriaticum]CAE7945851.1 unnamed protein product [Symbiodinium sp. KB8]
MLLGGLWPAFEAAESDFRLAAARLPVAKSVRRQVNELMCRDGADDADKGDDECAEMAQHAWFQCWTAVKKEEKRMLAKATAISEGRWGRGFWAQAVAAERFGDQGKPKVETCAQLTMPNAFHMVCIYHLKEFFTSYLNLHPKET